MNNKKKIFISVVIVLILCAIVVSATYAVYRWRSTYGLNVNITVNDNIVITFNGGTNITGRLIPTDVTKDMDKIIVKEMTIKSNLPTDGTYNLYLKTNELPSAIQDESFKWLLTDCDYIDDSYCGEDINISGDFSASSMSEYRDQTTGDLLLLDSSNIPFRKKLHLYLYLWIDGTVDNDISMGGNHIDFDLYATGTDGSLKGNS